jgi:hypothetical protein
MWNCCSSRTARTPTLPDVLQRSLWQLGLDVAVQEKVGDFPSPTILVDGVDVMTGATGVPAMYACRLDLPTETAVVAALRAVTHHDAGVYPARLAVGVTSDRIAQVSPAARMVHRVILRGFAATGHALGAEELNCAVPDGCELSVLLDELHDHDLVLLSRASHSWGPGRSSWLIRAFSSHSAVLSSS